MVNNNLKSLNFEDDIHRQNLKYINFYLSSTIRFDYIYELYFLYTCLSKSHVMYSILCSREDCVLPKSYYVRQTLNTISLRLTGHLQNRAIKEHMRNCHQKILMRK